MDTILLAQNHFNGTDKTIVLGNASRKIYLEKNDWLTPILFLFELIQKFFERSKKN